VRPQILRALTLLSLLTVLCTAAPAQVSPAPDDASSFLVRMERLREAEDDCVLVNRNGQYRFERTYQAKIEVYVGSLGYSEFMKLQNLLETDQLRSLSQKQIHPPLMSDSFDSFVLDIFRGNQMQHLFFSNHEGRQPFHDSLDPVLAWLDSLNKMDHTRIGDSAASRCSGGREILAADALTRPVVQIRLPSYVLRLQSDRIYGGLAEYSCVLVYGDGKYRLEKSTQQFRSTPQVRAFEASLTDLQVAELR